MLIEEIKKVCFVGAGTMGCYNSLLAGIAGYETVLYDISEEALAATSSVQEQLGEYLAAMGTFDKEQIRKGRDRIHLETTAEAAVENADLLSESVLEKLDLKRQVHGRFDVLCPPGTLLTTNTSTFMVSEIEDAVKRRDRFAAMHFHLMTPLVDVVAGPRTSPETLDVITRFVRSIACIPFKPAKESRGYVFNSLNSGWNFAATALAVEYSEKIEDIDRAWMSFHQVPVGPFAIMDLVGLNVYYDGIQDALQRERDNRTFGIIVELLQPYMDRNELGIKTGKGIYSYPDAAYGRPDFLTAVQPRQDIYKVLVNGIIIMAIKLAESGVAGFEDIDRVWMINTQASSGPFGWLDAKGIDLFLSEVESEERALLYPEYDSRQVPGFLEPFVQEGKTGKKAGQGFYAYLDPAYEDPGFLANPFQGK
ncbi:MAG: 3-hydroxyacyl-CoA dehydrogenase NAD-binding domain-containing protein [Thermodesulfobacteriota bacterium]